MGPVAPRTAYAKSGDLSIAYQVTGEGPIDLLVVPGWVSHVEHAWEDPDVAAFLRDYPRFAAVVDACSPFVQPVGRLRRRVR